MLGLTSITFRNLSVEEIVSLSAANGLDGIEWGGDIHVPPGDESAAALAKAATDAAGLQVLSYGSYYRLQEGEDFAPVLQSAVALGAPCIRVWAGAAGSAQTDTASRAATAQRLSAVAAQAAEKGVQIGLEYHRNTLTDTWQSARELLEQCGAKNVSTYWQPNPDLTLDQQLEEIDQLLPWITTVHVFQWEKGNVRFPLADGISRWNTYGEKLGLARNFLLEFVKDDSVAQFQADSKVLAELFRG
ncbi:sugar phosphate isomerase/epimerase [Ruminococcaceae bacterium OttesenSCG-928-L11]|nr:sugar phosphate isomerase/epimerase [Ruminococcaceae bacterium OttesenSCG-928-L11]